MKKIITVLLGIAFVFCFSVSIIGFSTENAKASSFKGEVMQENFLDEDFTTDNWIVREGEDAEGNDIPSAITITQRESFINVKNPTYDAATAVYIDREMIVANDTGVLVVEFDIVNETIYDSTFAIATGMQKDANGVPVLNEERRSQMIITNAGNQFLTVQAYGLPGNYSPYPQYSVYYNGTNFGSNAPFGGYGQIGYRYRLEYCNNGSMYAYRYKIEENGYGEEEAMLYVPSGMLQNKFSGYVGFFFYFSQAGINLQNVRLSTMENADGEELEQFNDSCKGNELDSAWKTINGNAMVNLSGYPRSARFDNPVDGNYIVSAGSKYITYDAVYDEYIKMTFGLKIEKLTGVRKFGLAFGFDKSSDNVTTEGVSYIHFTRNQTDATKIDICVSKMVDGEFVYSNAYSINQDSLIDKDINVEIIPYVSGKIDVKLGGTVYTFNIDGQKIILDKRFAFITSEGNSLGDDTVIAEISKIHITNRYDVVPEDIVDISEGFGGTDEKGKPWYDKELISFAGGVGYANGNLDAGVFIEDGELVFRNAGHNSYLSVAKPFGDFMLQMDITDIAREDLYSDSGDIFRPFMRSWIGITFGLPSPGSPYSSGYLLYFVPQYEEDAENPGKYKASANVSPVILLAPGEKGLLVASMRHNIIDPALKDKTIVVRLIVDAGVMKFSYYVKGEESMTMLDEPVMVYDNGGLGLGHTGYIGVTCTSASPYYMAGDFSLDNFVVKSLERNINITNDPDKPVESVVESVPESTPNKGEDEKEEKKGCKNAVAETGNITLLFIAFVIAIISISKKRKNI